MSFRSLLTGVVVSANVGAGSCGLAIWCVEAMLACAGITLAIGPAAYAIIKADNPDAGL